MQKLKYELIMDYIKEQVNKGVLREGDKIPSENELSAMFGVSRHTVRKAINELQFESYLYTEKGKGTFITLPKTETVSTVNAPKVIGVMVAYINDTIFPRILTGIDNTVGKSEYSIYWSCTRNDVNTEAETLKSMMDHNVAGIIVEPTHSAWPNPNGFLYEKIRQQNIPVLFIHGYYKNINGDINYIIVDDVDAGYKAAKCLIDNGHTQIGGIYKADDVQGYLRHEGFVKCLREHGLTENEMNVVWMDSTRENDMFNEDIIAKRYFERLSHCTGLICYNDDAALSLARGLDKAGIVVPDQVSIVGFDNNKLSDAYKVPFTSLTHPKDVLGEMAGNTIIQLIENPDLLIQKKLVVELIEKASVKKIQ